MYIILTGYICRFYKKMFITFKKLMFAIITGKYIIITGNIYRYYKECESRTYKGNVCHFYKNVFTIIRNV